VAAGFLRTGSVLEEITLACEWSICREGVEAASFRLLICHSPVGRC